MKDGVWLSERGSNPRAVLWTWIKEIATALPSELSENLLRELESNQRPPGYGPSALPSAPPRDVFDANIVIISYEVFYF